MYPTIVITSLIVLIVAVVGHFALQLVKERHGVRPPIGRVTGLLYGILIVSTLVAALSAWVPVVMYATPMRGWMLLLHSTVAGFFIVALACLTAAWAGGCRIAVEPDELGRGFSLGQKLTFCLAAALGLVVILSSVLCMTPLFGTSQQKWLINLHRYAGLWMVLALLIHAYLMGLAVLRRRSNPKLQGELHHETRTAS